MIRVLAGQVKNLKNAMGLKFYNMPKFEKPKTEKIDQDLDLGPSISAQLESRQENLPKIEKVQPLTIKDICHREGVKQAELENHLKAQIQAFAEKMKNVRSWGDDKYWPMLENWYNLFLQCQENDLNDDLAWVNNFKNFDDFINYFCPQVTNHAKSMIKKHVQDFLEKKVHPQKSIDGWEFRREREYQDNLGIYEADGQWVLLPEEYSSENMDLVEKQVIEEIIDLLKSGYPHPEYAHASGSAALSGVSQAKAILSARQSIEKKIPVKSGEFHHYWDQEIADVQDQPNRVSVLGSVYVNHGLPHYGYHSINWFDEYFVGFGINQQKQEEYLTQNNFYYGKGKDQRLSVDYGGEGIIIGPQVPLENVEIVYAWKKYEKQTLEWIKENCPQVKFISLEAIQTLTSYADIINKMALQDNITPEQAWQSLIKN